MNCVTQFVVDISHYVGKILLVCIWLVFNWKFFITTFVVFGKAFDNNVFVVCDDWTVHRAWLASLNCDFVVFGVSWPGYVFVDYIKGVSVAILIDFPFKFFRPKLLLEAHILPLYSHHITRDLHVSCPIISFINNPRPSEWLFNCTGSW